MNKNLETINYKNQTYALIIRSKNQFIKKSVNFLTKNSDLMQIGFLNHRKNHIITSHIHKKKKRVINYCTEVLIIKKGKIKVNFYNEKATDIRKSKILYKNDIIILFKGGHGFKILEACQMIEVKQGPYKKNLDKIILNEKKINSGK